MISYGLGCIPGAPIVARRHGVDLRRVGDGNPGAWNALDQLGWRRAWPAFAIDGLKGLLAAVLGWVVLGDAPLGSAAHAVLGRGGADVLGWLPWQGAGALGLDAWLPWACVGAAMLGHAAPLPHPADGGKSVMAFAGGALALVPVAGIPLVLLFGVAVVARRAALGARVAVFAFPVVQALVTPLEQVGWTGLLMTGIGLLFLVRRGDRRR
ncbi:MAG: glycerol-3-phosphate acyltransferase [Solirubrobacteraceae bacterium]|nr:glycerol-3-phosphate acyltransferase [Patulibacter sp.]